MSSRPAPKRSGKQRRDPLQYIRRPAPKTILSFAGSILTKNSEDALREFLINFCVEDSTFAVTEKAVRNSGFPGGRFIGTIKSLNPDTGKPYTADEVALGNEVVINCWRFRLHEASEGTLRTMETTPQMFKTANFPRIMASIKKTTAGKLSAIGARFDEFDPHHHGKVKQWEGLDILQEFGVDMGEPEWLILFRHYQFAKSDQFSYADFLADLR
jgi:hypothetical protein